MQKIVVTDKTKDLILDMLIDEGICVPDDPFWDLIKVVIQRDDITGVQIMGRVRLVFRS